MLSVNTVCGSVDHEVRILKDCSLSLSSFSRVNPSLFLFLEFRVFLFAFSSGFLQFMLSVLMFSKLL